MSKPETTLKSLERIVSFNMGRLAAFQRKLITLANVVSNHAKILEQQSKEITEITIILNDKLELLEDLEDDTADSNVH